jgi:hypothetical protein
VIVRLGHSFGVMAWTGRHAMVSQGAGVDVLFGWMCWDFTAFGLGWESTEFE